MSGEFIEFFNELLYGSGLYIGFLLIVAIIFLISAKSKMASIVMIPFCIFMGLFYLDNISVNALSMWFALLMFLCSVLLVIRVGKSK